MRPLQVTTVLTCLMINLIDGYDVLAISFAAPAITDAWQLSPTDLGTLLSAGLAGMTLASILLAPVADYIGRRKTILWCLVLVTLGMAASANASTLTELTVYRFVTGIGVGTLLPSLNTMVAEFSSLRRRELAVTIMQAGYPLGAILGGIVAILLLEAFGWRAIFATGALLSAMLIPMVYWRMPESLDYLLTRGESALPELNRLLNAFGRPALKSSHPHPAQAHQARIGYGALQHGGNGHRALVLCGAFFFVMGSFYFVASWTPKLLVDAGLDQAAASQGGIILNLSGVAGGITLGMLAHRLGARPLTIVYLLSAGFFMWAFTQTSTVAPMFVATGVLGFFLIGSMMGLYGMTPSLFDPAVRATATGLAVGVGRLGAVAGPYAVGVLLESGWSAASIYMLFAAPLLVAALVLLYLHRSVRRDQTH